MQTLKFPVKQIEKMKIASVSGPFFIGQYSTKYDHWAYNTQESQNTLHTLH